jgi:hypothetical protein
MSAAYWQDILRANRTQGRRRKASLTESGWADDRLMTAYDLIWDVMNANAAADIDREFAAVLRTIEAADELLLEGRTEA